MESERDWERLGIAFAEARKAADLTQVEVAERLSVTRTPIQAIERGRQPNGRPFGKVTTTMRAYARLVGWTEDSPARILKGEEPEPATQPVPTTDPGRGFGLPSAVERELRSGDTLDSAVIYLNPENSDDDTRVIVVLKGDEGLSEEELDRRWEQWKRTRRQVQGIASDPEATQGS